MRKVNVDRNAHRHQSGAVNWLRNARVKRRSRSYAVIARAWDWASLSFPTREARSGIQKNELLANLLWIPDQASGLSGMTLESAIIFATSC